MDQLEVDAEISELDEASVAHSQAKPVPVNAASQDRPAWFKGKPKRQAARDGTQSAQVATRRPKPYLGIAADTGEEMETPWQQKCRDWFLGMAAGAYGMSLLIHLLLIGTLSLIIMDNFGDAEAFSTRITENERLDMLFDDLIDTKLSLAGSDAEQTQLPQLPALPTQNPVKSVNIEPQLAAIAGQADSGQEGDGSGFVFKMPSHGKVVTKGSFTAWTEPQDPQPGQDYIIVIQIKLPEKIRRYRVSDLSGLVVGTDKYRQVIPWDSRKPYASMTTRGGKLVPIRRRQYLPLVKRQAQLMVKIPGAHRLVKDTIQIRSKILKEEQTIEIEF